MMSRRTVLGGMGAAGLAAFLGEARAAGERPNFIQIVADDLGWADLRCYGNPGVRTPVLDQMARQGILYTHGYAPATVCSPSRSGMLTGRYPARDRIFSWMGENRAKPDENKDRGMPDFLDPARPTVASTLKAAGYATGLFGKWHLGRMGGAPEPRAYGFDTYRVSAGNGPYWAQDPPFRPRSSQLIVDETLAFIEAHAATPFLAHVWFLDPHVPVEPLEDALAAYPTGKGVLRSYFAAITNMDLQIGRLLQGLDALGLSGRTVVVFTSDNGPSRLPELSDGTAGAGNAGPFRGCKGSLYEGGIRVPFLLRWPGVAPAGRVDDTTVVTGVDWLPTACGLAGVPVPADIDGVDLSASFRGQSMKRGPCFWEWRSAQGRMETFYTSPMLAMRSGDWKLLMNPDGSRVELYDLRRDPSEVDNLARENPSVVDTLRPALVAWFGTLPEAPLSPAAGQNRYPWPQDTQKK